MKSQILVAAGVLVVILLSSILFLTYGKARKLDASENLAFSCRRSDPEAVKDVQKYIDEGADVDFELNEDRPLDRAAEAGNLVVVNALLKNGAHLNLTKKSTQKTVHKMLENKK